MAILTKNIYVTLFVLTLTFAIFETHASQESWNKTFALMVNKIKLGCNDEHPSDDDAFKVCAQNRYNAMRSFYKRLFNNRDTKGVKSKEFSDGLSCIDKYAPVVNELDRKYAVELTDWIQANKCYENLLK